jgi:ketosteroid isomerase-like protein
MGESNSAIIRKAYEDFAHGNIPSVFAAFDAGIIWHVPGHSPLSVDYTGHDQIGGFFQRTMRLSRQPCPRWVNRVDLTMSELLPLSPPR